MNHEQWTKLREATKGHTPGPWAVSDGEDSDIIADNNAIWFEGWTDADVSLTAAAPDLLAEVERLRGWLRVIVDRVSIRSDTLTEKQINAALDGAEVPE